MKKTTKPKTYGKGPVRYFFTQGEGSPLSVNVDFRLARVPETYTYADCVSLKNDEAIGITTILLGQMEPERQPEAENTKLTSCVKLIMPSSALYNAFLPSVKSVEEVLAEQTKAMNLPAVRRPILGEAVTGVTRFANVILLATSLGEASLDFYYMSGRDLHFARLYKTEIDLEPQIRVILPLPVVQYFLELCHSAIAQSPANIARSTNRARASLK